jgi:hypothetical protein
VRSGTRSATASRHCSTNFSADGDSPLLLLRARVDPGDVERLADQA